jgi:hypothetical protein
LQPLSTNGAGDAAGRGPASGAEPAAGRRIGLGDLALVLTAGLAFADATIVTLALPNVLVDLGTGVYGVAAVLGVYTAAVAAAAVPAGRLARRVADPRLAVGALLAFSATSAVCALAPDLGVLLGARLVQGAAAALVLAVAGNVLESRRGGGRAWVSVAVLGAAIGPVLGGALTQAFSWRAIFVAQAPVPLIAAALFRGDGAGGRGEEADAEIARRPLLALGLVSGALTALLFGVVLLLVVGWAMRPLSAALAATIVPLAAFAGSRVRGGAETRVIAGAGLLAGGIGALAFLPTNDVRWLVAPELVGGLGMGLALTALLETLLPETTSRRRATNLAVRHLGVTLTLVLLAPVVAHELSGAVETAKLDTVAVVLDSPISPVTKIRLAPRLVAPVRTDRPLAAIRQEERRARADVSASERPAFDATFGRIEQIFVRAAADAFRWAFLIAGALSLAAAVTLVSRARAAAVATAGAAGLALVGAQALAHRLEAPRPVALADPCSPRTLPRAGGLEGAAQTLALRALDHGACRLGATREELLLALADRSEAARFEDRHGVNPRSIGGLLRMLG